MKYIVATISFLFVLFGVIISYVAIYDFIILVFFPMQAAILFIGFGWQSFPGWILGLWAGIHSWKVSFLKAEEKKTKKQNKN